VGWESAVCCSSVVTVFSSVVPNVQRGLTAGTHLTPRLQVVSVGPVNMIARAGRHRPFRRLFSI